MPKPTRRPMTWEGVTYPSIYAASRATGLSFAAMHYYYRQGYTRQEEVRGYRPVVWDGVYYESPKQAAYQLGVRLVTFRSWIRSGYTRSDQVQPIGRRRKSSSEMVK